MSKPQHLTSYSTLPYKEIKLSHHPSNSPIPTPVIIITLYRPSQHNAFTDLMATEFISALTQLSSDPRVRCIVVTGQGRMFCAGADLQSGLSSQNDTVQNHRDGGGKVALAIQNCLKPVIGAINGSAVGVGITMTLPMNIRIVSEKAKIGFVFARRGIVMEACSSYYLPRLIGFSKAMHLITTGAVYPATHKLFSELFSEVVDDGRVLDRALEIAEEVASNTSLVSTTLMKDMMFRGPGTPEEVQLLSSKILMGVFASKDRDEGVNSFMEKRKADFKGTMENAPEVWPWWLPVDMKPKL